MSRYHLLSDDEILEAIQPNAKLLRAVTLDERTRFLVLHLPGKSSYQDRAYIQRFKDAFARVSIAIKIYELGQDSFIYVFCRDWIPTAEGTALLAAWCRQNEFLCEGDPAKILPSQAPLPLPLSLGFTWVNEDGQLVVRSEQIALKSAMAMFMSDLSRCATGWEEIKSALTVKAQLEPTYNQDLCAVPESTSLGSTDEIPALAEVYRYSELNDVFGSTERSVVQETPSNSSTAEVLRLIDFGLDQQECPCRDAVEESMENVFHEMPTPSCTELNAELNTARASPDYDAISTNNPGTAKKRRSKRLQREPTTSSGTAVEPGSTSPRRTLKATDKTYKSSKIETKSSPAAAEQAVSAPLKKLDDLKEATQLTLPLGQTTTVLNRDSFIGRAPPATPTKLT